MENMEWIYPLPNKTYFFDSLLNLKSSFALNNIKVTFKLKLATVFFFTLFVLIFKLCVA